MNYLIDSTFTNFNRLFVFSFARTNTGDNRDYFSNYYMPSVEIKDFNILIDGKSFFLLPVKKYRRSLQKIIEMDKNNDYTTGNQLGFAYFNENYRLIATDLSKQTKLKDPHQINFTGTLDQNNGATMFFFFEKSEVTTFKFS